MKLKSIILFVIFLLSIPKSQAYTNPVANFPLLLVLKGHCKEARALYMRIKDQPFDEPCTTYKDEFLVDFKELAQVGVTSKDIKKIIALLNSKE